jgi:tetratricopeptide (TPR) repeat protein
MKMENYLEYIDAYFNHELKPEEARQFEQKIIEDRNFAKEVAFYLSTKQVLKEEIIAEKKKQFRELLGQNSSSSKLRSIAPVRKLWAYAAAAAAIVFILFAGYLFLFRQTTSPPQMAEEYVKQNLQSLGVTMGNSQDSLQNALRLYNEGRLNASLEQFESMVQRDSSNNSAKEYAGIVYLRLGNYDKALAYFQQLEKYSLASNPAIFYQALTLLKRNQPGDKQQARQLLQQVVANDLKGKETAQQWLEKKW